MFDSEAGADATTHTGSDFDRELLQLLRAVCRGCRPSFSRLHDLTRNRLFAIVMRITRDRADAEDVLQETYVKVWNRCAQFDESRSLAFVWLASISQHSALDSLRRRRVRPRTTSLSEDEEGPGLDPPSNELPPLEGLQHKVRVEAVRSCLRAQPAPHREALVLAFYAGLSHGEIAVSLGRPLGTVKTWLRRSLADMRPQLADHR